jgi:hypothetical protein
MVWVILGVWIFAIGWIIHDMPVAIIWCFLRHGMSHWTFVSERHVDFPDDPTVGTWSCAKCQKQYAARLRKPY